VNAEPGADPGLNAGGQEDRPSPVGQPQDAAVRHGEYEIIGALALDGRRDLAGQEAGHRDGTGLVRFRGAENDTATDVREGPADVDPAAVQVDIADAQGGGLAPAQARVSEQQDEQAGVPGLGGQVAELAMSQDYVVAALNAGQAQAARGIGPDTPAADSVIKGTPSGRAGAVPALADSARDRDALREFVRAA